MEKRTIDPWVWGPQTNSVQAVEVTNATGTLYCSGQVALDENGVPSNADMRTQLQQTIKNLEQLIQEAGYDCKNIVRLNIYTTNMQEFFYNVYGCLCSFHSKKWNQPSYFND